MDTQTQIDRLIELAIVQRSELKQIVSELPQLREYLGAEIERTFEEAEPQIRIELEEFCKARATDEYAKTGAALAAKVEQLSKQLEVTTAAKYSVLMAERAENANLLAKAEARIEDAASMLSGAVKEIVTDELSRFPRAGEIDQLRKEFAEPRGLNPRGRWMVDETYQRLDLVTINGDSFVSNIDGNRERPSRTAGDWTLSAARGNGGGGGGVTSMTDLVPVPSNGQLLIGNGTGFVNSTLTAGSGVTISNGAGSITIASTGAGSGTVTSVSVTTANGVSGSVATSTTTPAITLTLGAIAPTSVNSVVVSGSATPTLAVSGTTSVSGANTGDQTITLTGDVTGSGTGSFATAIASGVIVNADVNASAAIAYSKLNLATSIVNADIGASAAIVDTKLATISTASKVSNSATTAASANTASAIVARDASGNFTAGTITAALTGNASTATLASTSTALATARTINGTSFDGTANITVTAAGSTLSDTVTIAKGGTGQVTAQAALNALLPSQAGASGKVLQSDGTNTSFVAAGGSGTVTSVSVTTANGVSGTVATSTTTPAISLTLGAIVPTSVNSVVVSGASSPTLAVTGTTSVSGANTGDQTITLTGGVTGSGTGSFAATVVTNANLTGGVTSVGNAATVVTNANLTGDVTSVGNATAIAAGVIVNADINASAAIVDTKLNTISTALKVSNSATTAASANTASAIVARDASGNFTAGTITANLTGNASGSSGSTTGNAATATALATGRTIAITGDLAYTSASFDGTSNVTAAGTLATVATAGTTGGSTAIPVVTINAKGLTTSITTAAVIAPAGTLTGNTLASGVTASSLTSLGTVASLTVTAGTISTTPTASTDIANKLYVDTVAQGLDAKASCIAATTANITLSGTQTVDGIVLVATDRVLVKNQTLSQNNGIYLCAAGAWTRTSDADTWDELTSAFTFVETGTVNADTGYVCTADAGGTLGTTALPWSQFSGAGSYTASTGLTLTGTAFSLTAPVTVALGGTNATTAGIASFNNITGYTASGATGTTSTNLVFSTSPTLVTPALGTPSSATLTNATGLPLTTGVTGTLPVANGGTGVTTSTGTTNVVLSGSPTIVTPVIAQINDASGNETLKLASIASAVNEITIENAATGNAVHISATGGDASVGLHLAGKGASGYVNVQDSSDATKRIMFNAAGGTTNTRTMLSSTQTVDRTISLPDATDTLVGKATTDTLTNKTLTSPTLTTPALGTPSSGTLSSCTGLALTTGVTGILPAANGGTGVANNAAMTVTGSGNFAFTRTLTAATNVTFPTTGTLATLAGSETFTNKTLTSPTLTTPALGTPASGVLSSCTVDGTDKVGFLNIPQNSQSAAYTLVLADAGKHIFHPSGDANARTYTIPANSSVAYTIGTAITFINMTSQVVSIAITTDTMYLSSAGTTGTRSLAQYGSATAIKMTSTTWLISGSGLT